MSGLTRIGPTVCAALLAVGLQQPPQSPQPLPPSTGALLGTVVDATSGRPVPGAIVTLSGGPARPPLPPGVTLSPAESAALQAALQAASAPRRVMTDGSGVFAFNSLPKASFRLSADATGYLSSGYGQQRPNQSSRQFSLDQGERRTGLTIKMWQYAGVGGTITDDAGDPAVGVTVMLLFQSVSGSRRQLQQRQSTQTDDRGAYRFGGLSPGDYGIAVPQSVTSMPASLIETFMAAQNTPNGADAISRDLQTSGAPGAYSTGLRMGDQQYQLSGMNGGRLLAPPAPADRGRTFAYQTMFYPAATAAGDASIIPLTSGQDRSGIDVQMRMVQTVKVSGTVVGPDGPAANMGIRVVPAGADSQLNDSGGFETATSATDASGAFMFPAVPAGAYLLRAYRVPRPGPAPPPPPPQPGGRGVLVMGPLPAPLPADPVLWAELPVSVGDTELTGLSVVLRPGARVSGRIVFEGNAPAVSPDALQRMSVSVSPADGRSPLGSSSQGRVSANAQFTTAGYAPGRYFVTAGSPSQGWYFKSAMLGGKKVDEDPLEIQGSDVSGVTITFTDRTTELSGTVRDPASPRDLNAMLFIFPADYAALIDRGTLGRRSRNTTIGGSGAFTMNGLPPGEYLAVAIGLDAVSDTRDKAFFDSLARAATRFSLGDGEKRTLDLAVSPIR